MLNITKSNNILPDPETLLIRPFNEIWERDKSINKIEALRVFSYIYFKYNPKSLYLKSATGKELENRLKEDILLDKKWKADKVVLKAEEIYKDKMFSTGMKLLKSAQNAIEMIGIELDGFTLDDIEDKKDRVDVMTKLLSAIEKVDTAAMKLTSAQKRLEEEHLSSLKQTKKHLSNWELPPSQR